MWCTVHTRGHNHSIKGECLASFNLQYPFAVFSVSLNLGHVGAQPQVRPEVKVVGVALHVVSDLVRRAVRRHIAREWEISKAVLNC